MESSRKPHRTRTRLGKFIAEEHGQSVVEYALLLLLIAAGVAIALPFFGIKLTDLLKPLSNTMKEAAE